ncbi:hypothetical protein ACF0H5_006696 [Mactra antiquata]
MYCTICKEFSDAMTSTPIVSRSQLVSSFHDSPVTSDVDMNNNKCFHCPGVKKGVDLSGNDGGDDDDDTLIDIVNVSTEADHHLSDINTVVSNHHGDKHTSD